MKLICIPFLAVFAFSCSSPNEYDIKKYYGNESDSVITSIIAHLYSAPPYTSMKDRLESVHRKFYSSLLPKFSMVYFSRGKNGVNYFYLLRPGAKIGDQRGVGGEFKMISGNSYKLESFRETFVSPVLPEDQLRTKFKFMFEEMVKGNIGTYLKMPSYVQWPSSISSYDTLTHEWILIPEKVGAK